METFPTTPKFAYPLNIETAFSNVASEFPGDIQVNRLLRFPMHSVPPLQYNYISQANRNILYSFWRKRYGGYQRFWFFDTVLRAWYDEYIGQGGSWELTGALLKDNTAYTHYTDEANDATAGDFYPLPAAPVVNQDGFVVIAKQQFDIITCTIATPGAGVYTILWKYWKSDNTWATLSATDNTTHFRAAAGARTVTFTVPADWAITTIDGIEGYAAFADLTAFTNMTTRPILTTVTVNSQTYDLPGKTITHDATFFTYLDGVDTAHTFVSGGGQGGADRVTFGGYPAQGALITTDFYGYLRIPAIFKRSEGDRFQESIQAYSGSVPVYNVNLPIEQARW